MLSELYPSNSFFLIGGPCAIEGYEVLDETASHLKSVCKKLNIPLVFKGSYRKANRSSITSFTGIGDAKALDIMGQIKEKYGLRATTDIHADEEAAMAAEVVDVLQIPAFLCRQTALLVAAAKTGKMVNIKKGQFMSPESMQFAVKKVTDSGNNQVGLIERGNSFGYQDLIVDFRGITTMKTFGVPVIMDCTHSLQQPNQTIGITGGRPDMIETIAKAAIATGADGLFIETHPDPSIAKSDGANMLPLDKIEELLTKLVKLRAAVI